MYTSLHHYSKIIPYKLFLNYYYLIILHCYVHFYLILLRSEKFLVFMAINMGDVGIKLLSDFLLSNGNILVDVCILGLSFNSTSLTPNSAAAISNIIQGNTLHQLDLSCNELGDKTIAEISQVLKVNSTLKTLTLSLNVIGVEGAKSLATALCHNHTLEHLYIDNNAIMDDGVIAINECFKISGRTGHLNDFTYLTMPLEPVELYH